MRGIRHKAIPIELTAQVLHKLHHVVASVHTVAVHHVEMHAIVPRLNAVPSHKRRIMGEAETVHDHAIDPTIDRIREHHHVHAVRRESYSCERISPARNDGSICRCAVNPIALVVLT